MTILLWVAVVVILLFILALAFVARSSREPHLVEVVPLPGTPVIMISDCCNHTALRTVNPNNTGQCSKCEKMAIFYPSVECECKLHPTA